MIKIYEGTNSKISMENIISDINLQVTLEELKEEKSLKEEFAERKKFLGKEKSLEKEKQLFCYLEENLEKMKETARIQVFSERRFQTIKWDWHGFLKKIIQKLTEWYIQKIEQQQTEFNQYMMQCMIIQQKLLEQLYEKEKEHNIKKSDTEEDHI